jgi:hypothetical protein
MADTAWQALLYGLGGQGGSSSSSSSSSSSGCLLSLARDEAWRAELSAVERWLLRAGDG